MPAQIAQIVGVCLMFVVLGGCGRDSGKPVPPFETFEVTGKVTYKDVGKDIDVLERAKVWFQSKAKPDLMALGAVGDDGSFFMTVLTEDKTFAGVPEGDYRVRIEPPPDDETRTPRPDVIHVKYQSFGSSGLSVRIPTSGELTFVVEPPPRQGS